MQRAILSMCTLLVFCGMALGEEVPGMKGEKDRISYSLGYQIGGDFRQQQMELHADAFLQGLEDAVAAVKPQPNAEEMHSTLAELKSKIVAEQKRQQLAAVKKYRDEGETFLAQNAKKEGVTVLPSGLQYKVIRPGTGKNPGPSDRVTVHYRGTLVNGQEFYNSRRGKETPDTFHAGGVIKGFGEALQRMKEGAEWQLFIPENLAYGERGPVGERAVIFYVELISTEPAE